MKRVAAITADLLAAAGRGLAGALPIPTIFTGLRQGRLEVRLARDEAEIRDAQRLRYRVFYEEMQASPSDAVARERRDFDRFDAFCDHLLVIHHGDSSDVANENAGRGLIVGTYRLLRRSVAEKNGGFYSAGEFDLAKLLAVRGELLELGRACVDADYRSRPTMQLLWRGVASYVMHYRVKVMFGCASLPGTDPQQLAPLLSYLHHNHLAPQHLRARALADRFVATDALPAHAIDAESAIAQLDARAAISALPPLIKGYLRLGGMIGEGAVIDPEFQTIDVCLIVVTDQLAEKYFNHFLRNGI
jgi:putative hemolysin